MKRFDIILTSKAQSDTAKLRDAIVFKYRAPLTAKRYLNGLNEEVVTLENNADAVPIDEILSAQYGLDIKRINYKEMAILFVVEGTNVYILRIIPQSLIVY